MNIDHFSKKKKKKRTLLTQCNIYKIKNLKIEFMQNELWSWNVIKLDYRSR